MALSTQKNNVVTVQFLKWTNLYLKEKPFQMFVGINLNAKGQCYSNLQFEERSITVENIRGYEESFELDKHGFIVRRFPKGALCLLDPIISKENVVSNYFPAVDKLLRTEVEGVDRTFLLDWRVICLFYAAGSALL
jgi:hypothetical protein